MAAAVHAPMANEQAIKYSADQPTLVHLQASGSPLIEETTDHAIASIAKQLLLRLIGPLYRDVIILVS